MDAGEWQSWLAGGSAVIAIGAASFSWWQAREAAKQVVQARRQADAAHGDVEPTFHLEPIRTVKEEWTIQFVARNFNRHPVLMDTVTISFPSGFVVVKGTKTAQATWKAVENSIQQDQGRYLVRSMETLPGLPPGGENTADSRFTISLRPTAHKVQAGATQVQILPVQDGDNIKIDYGITYKILDGRDLTCEKSGTLSLAF